MEKYEDLEILEVGIRENIETVRDEFGGVYISYKNEYLDGFYITKLRKNKKDFSIFYEIRNNNQT